MKEFALPNIIYKVDMKTLKKVSTKQEWCTLWFYY